MKRSWLSSFEKPWSTGWSQARAAALLHSCIGFLWLPIEAASDSQPTTEKRELHREENSNEAPKVEVQPENLLEPGSAQACPACFWAKHRVLTSLLKEVLSLSSSHILSHLCHLFNIIRHMRQLLRLSALLTEANWSSER